MLKEFLDLAQAEGVWVIDATHYGTEMPPQLAMVDWFQQRGLPRHRSSPTARSSNRPAARVPKLEHPGSDPVQ